MFLTWSRSTDSFSIFSRPVETSTSPYCDSNHSRTITLCQVLFGLFFHFLYAEVFPLSCSKTAAHNWQGFVSNMHRFFSLFPSNTKPLCHILSPMPLPAFLHLFYDRSNCLLDKRNVFQGSFYLKKRHLPSPYADDIVFSSIKIQISCRIHMAKIFEAERTQDALHMIGCRNKDLTRLQPTPAHPGTVSPRSFSPVSSDPAEDT